MDFSIFASFFVLMAPQLTTASPAEAVRAFPGLTVGAFVPFTDSRIRRLPRCVEAAPDRERSKTCFQFDGINYAYRLDDRTISEKWIVAGRGALPYGLRAPIHRTQIDAALSRRFNLRLDNRQVYRKDGSTQVERYIDRSQNISQGCVEDCNLLAVYDPQGRLIEISVLEFDGEAD